MFQVVHRVSGAFQRFRQGMKTFGVLDAIRMHRDASDRCFVTRPPHSQLMDYVLDVEEQEGPLKLGVDFLHELPLRHGCNLPTANTCNNFLQLPVLKKFKDFKETMDCALKTLRDLVRNDF
ncbi:hypothetical protein FQN60_000439 [Etheostoma spectabile]|uniref:HECT domain-containing protein n=1 Tax=Etheostoma spectabile TaxID=54343 RepID=A0A5J5D0E6_9PERO|nr:hypothetical protein FQN60_000439 [Etheostoma spectabile]